MNNRIMCYDTRLSTEFVCLFVCLFIHRQNTDTQRKLNYNTTWMGLWRLRPSGVNTNKPPRIAKTKLLEQKKLEKSKPLMFLLKLEIELAATILSGNEFHILTTGFKKKFSYTAGQNGFLYEL